MQMDSHADWNRNHVGRALAGGDPASGLKGWTACMAVAVVLLAICLALAAGCSGTSLTEEEEQLLAFKDAYLEFSDSTSLSEQQLYNDLTSEYGYQYSEEAAQWAIDALDADYSENALEVAEMYGSTLSLSEQGIYDALTSEETGYLFTDEEAQAAIDELGADYEANALETAEDYSTSNKMSEQVIYDLLVDVELFTEDQAEYAMENLDADFEANALETAQVYADQIGLSDDAIYDQLVDGDLFAEEEAQYAVDNLGTEDGSDGDADADGDGDGSGTDDEVSAEYLSALKDAYLQFSDAAYSSESIVSSWLVSSGYSEEAAEYAVENFDTDYAESALYLAGLSAANYSEDFTYTWLTSEYYGYEFTDEEAEYALENVDADYDSNALNMAETYYTSYCMSEQAIYDRLVSINGFTKSEAQYAIDELEEEGASYEANALDAAVIYQLQAGLSSDEIYDQLVDAEQFTEDEAEYAIAYLM